jgi:hypothetical protein
VAAAAGKPQKAHTQDYKDASLYYGAYPAYAYGGDKLLLCP